MVANCVNTSRGMYDVTNVNMEKIVQYEELQLIRAIRWETIHFLL